jgi:hypothetical protein
MGNMLDKRCGTVYGRVVAVKSAAKGNGSPKSVSTNAVLNSIAFLFSYPSLYFWAGCGRDTEKCVASRAAICQPFYIPALFAFLAGRIWEEINFLSARYHHV